MTSIKIGDNASVTLVRYPEHWFVKIKNSIGVVYLTPDQYELLISSADQIREKLKEPYEDQFITARRMIDFIRNDELTPEQMDEIKAEVTKALMELPDD